MRTALMLLFLAACSKPAPAPPAKDSLAVGGRRVDIKVTRAGYDPASVPAKPGELVTLVFNRTEDTSCGAEIAVPSLGVKKALPLNTPVAVDVKAEKEGEITFACGMGMMHGVVVVQAN